MRFGPSRPAEELEERFEFWEQTYRTSPLPLYGIEAANTPEPRSLGNSLRADGQTRRLGLAYGRPLPLGEEGIVQVLVSFPGSAPDPLELISQEHESRSLGPVGAIETDSSQVTIEDHPEAATFTRSSEVWVAEIRLAHATIDVVSTRWDPEGEWRLVRIDDVEPFILGWRRLLGRP